MAELVESFDNLVAMKDSGGDHRRITANHALMGERLALFAGLDDMPVEAVACGAVGWIAGLVNALPAESVATPSGSSNCPSPLPKVPHCSRKVPVASNFWIRSFSVSAT